MVDGGSISGSASTVECEELLDAHEPVRQGDVIEWLDGAGNPWRQHAIVVTADCDIVHSKHQGSLATVPVLRYDEFLAAVVLPGKLRLAETNVRDRARAQIRTMQGRHRPDRPEPLADAAIDEWIAFEDAAAILRTLRAPADERAGEFAELVAWLRELPYVVGCVNLTNQLSALTRSRVLCGSKQSPETIRAALARENVERVKQLPGDALFLHSLGTSLAEGYIAYLRRVDSVAEASVALRSSDLADAGMLARRVSRLSSPYVYRLTQQLGQVFSSIGLPGSYESSRTRFIVEQSAALTETS